MKLKILLLSILAFLNVSIVHATNKEYPDFIKHFSAMYEVPYDLSFAVFEVVSGFDKDKEVDVLCGVAQLPQYIYAKAKVDCFDARESILLGIKRLNVLIHEKKLKPLDAGVAYRFGDAILKRDKLPVFVENYKERIKHFRTVYKIKY